jgi:ribosomal protein L6P/L9E
MLKKISLNVNFRYSLFLYLSKVYLVLENRGLQSYLCLPYESSFNHVRGSLSLARETMSRARTQLKRYQFVRRLKIIQLKGMHEGFATLRMQGSGLVFQLNDEHRQLEVRIGRNTRVRLTIPTGVTISLFKKKLLLESSNREVLGNFCSIIRNTRRPNVFTGQGLWLRGDTTIFKGLRKAQK